MKRFQKLLCLILLSAISLSLADQANASITCNPWVAKMVSVQGTVEVNRAGQTQWLKAQINDTYCAGDRIQVGERSRADLALVNRPKIRLEQNTTLTLGGVRDEKRSIIQLARGALYFFSRLPQNLEIITAFVNAGVEGTEGLVKVDADSTLITIFEGRVVASNPAGSLILTGGQSAIARKGSAPVLTTIVRPRDAVQWALYYPPVFDFKPENFPNAAWQPSALKSIAAYKQGNFAAAFESLRAVPDTIADSTFFSYRAALLLAVGRNDEASRDVQRALNLRANDSAALALQAVIGVAQNEKEKALDSAQKAVTADPKSSSALIALSYAQQANFNLEGARNSLKQAVEANPNDALAWARLAELHLSFADLDDALAAAKRATAVDPNLSRTQMVLGYAFLTRVNTNDSKKAFEKAIQLDQADPLPRLGLGLAKIREGDLADGREEIDIAVSLDPDNSLIRSYLGKTYFEEKLDKKAAIQYGLAKSLDSKDPTPYFYDAIHKQSNNRPIEALQDMQKAIELNNNRAVYRSRLLLDEDLAARSASLGRIYNDLGFQELALVQGWKSVNSDPTNYSAHRLLADNYAALPRHEIARVSELLQSQLLQPINLTPLQPLLAESNLLLVQGSGPSSPSFTEFNPLFARNRLALQASSVFGSNRTLGDEITQSGVWNNFSYSLGQFHFETNGFRKNNDQSVNIYNAFAQAQISPRINVQAEVRHRDVRSGDLDSLFSPTEFDVIFQQNTRKNTASDTYRLGLNVSSSQQSVLLGSFIYLDERNTIKLLPEEPATVTASNGYLSEMQFLFRENQFNAIFGTGYYRLHQTTKTDIFRTKEKTKHFNAYLYTRTRFPSSETWTIGQTQFPSSLTWTIGLNGDIFDTDAFIKSRNRVNPKFGVLWNIFKETVVRAAWFRAFKRSALFSQTLEPTQVAGFNQFFDDFKGTISHRWGIGLDHRFARFLTGGVEFARRYLEVPPGDHWIESTHRAYLQITPHRSWAIEVEYAREKFANFEPFGPLDTDTQTIPFTMSYFDPSGFYAKFRTTYLRQKVITDSSSEADHAGFVDLVLGYRLPKRTGIFEIQLQNLADQKYRYEGLHSRRSPERTGLPSPLPNPQGFAVAVRLNLAF